MAAKSSIRVAAAPIYGRELSQLCSQTQTNLRQLQLQLAVDKCHEGFSSRAAQHASEKEPDADNHWQNLDVIFTEQHFLDGLQKDYVSLLSNATNTTELGNMNSYCYLCTTQEEHRCHLKTVRKVHGKARRKYEAPPPRPSSRTTSAINAQREQKVSAATAETAAERLPPGAMLYKVTVKTGNQAKCGTRSTVHLRIFGTAGNTAATELSKSRPNFAFLPNSKEAFTVRSPVDIGSLKKIQLMRSTDSSGTSTPWFVEFVEITCLGTHRTYTFHANKWLFSDAHTTVEKLKGELAPDKMKDYAVTVVTGKTKNGGTDSRVFITLIGPKGRSAKIELKNAQDSTGDESGHDFGRGQTVVFNFAADDVGAVRKIRIEHDGSGTSTCWHLLRVSVTESRSGRTTLFCCNQLLANEDGNATWRELEGKRTSAQSGRNATSTDLAIPYELEIFTGAVTYAGTNANVFVEIIGSSRSTEHIVLPQRSLNYSKAFEKGQADRFQVSTLDIGEVKKLRIGHDNTGLSPGWFLDKVIVRKFHNKSEVSREQATRPHKNSGQTTNGSSESEDEGLSESRSKPTRWGKKRQDGSTESESGSNDDSTNDESDKHEADDATRRAIVRKKMLDRLHKRQREARPIVKEYTFEVCRWLASDEGDGQLILSLQPQQTRQYEA